MYAVVAMIVAAKSANAASPRQDYVLYCMGCHGEHAQGIPGRIPPLAHFIARFMRTPAGRQYVLRVPGVSGSALPDARIASVLNWLAEKFDDEDLTAGVPLFSQAEVAAARRFPLADVASARRRVMAELVSMGQPPRRPH